MHAGAPAAIGSAALAHLLQHLASSSDGLSESDAERRLGTRGFNEPRHHYFAGRSDGLPAPRKTSIVSAIV